MSGGRAASAPPPGVLHVVLSLGTGGTERLVVEICRRLRTRVRAAVCALDDPGVWAAELERHGIDVVPLHRQPGFRPTLGYRIARLARRYGARVIHCHHYSPFVYGTLAALFRPGLRVVFTEHGRLSNGPPSVKRRRVNPLLGRWPHAIYAVSHDLRRSMIDEGFPADRIRVLHNGIDVGAQVTSTQRADARATLGCPGDSLVVGTVARLDPVKDVGTLIAAISIARRSNHNLMLAIVGDGDERSQLERAAIAHDVAGAVRFLGNRDDARKLMAGFDLYVNCSTSEGVSLSILEAMASGLPVVATAVGGTPEVIDHGRTGMLVPASNPRALAEALSTLAADRCHARTLGAAARFAVEQQFTIDRMVDHYAQVYSRLAS